jgi:hypothetical protein
VFGALNGGIESQMEESEFEMLNSSVTGLGLESGNEVKLRSTCCLVRSAKERSTERATMLRGVENDFDGA